MAEAQNSLREQLAKEVEAAQARWQSTLDGAVEAVEAKAAERLKEKAKHLRAELAEESEKQSEALRHALASQAAQLAETLTRADQATERLEQHAGRMETVQLHAISGFQSQLDDVLSLHRNELHRQSDSLFEEIHGRIRGSFEAANSQALSTRQSIAVSALALANQSQQSVLKLLQ